MVAKKLKIMEKPRNENLKKNSTKITKKLEILNKFYILSSKDFI